MKIYTSSGTHDYTCFKQKPVSAMCNILIVSQVCAVERKEHAAHFGAGSKEAKAADAESRKNKEGWCGKQLPSAPSLWIVVMRGWFIVFF